MTYTLHHGDCLDILRALPDNSVDAIVTDPPYGLSFMGKRWDYDVPSEDIWRECLRVLKPGGHLLAFAGTRTQHRMAVRIEDAGFEIRDMIAWVYGSGFPKSLDVSKAIDKAAGADREVVGSYKRGMAMHPGNEGADNWRENYTGEVAITTPATDAAKQWQGWGTALKPALEPITVARKPLIGTVAQNVLTWGTGGVNVDASRVGVDASDPNQRSPKWYDSSRYDESSNCYGKGLGGKQGQTNLSTLGRWPANLIHDGSEEVVGLFPESKSVGVFPATQNTASWKMSSKGNGLSPARLMADSGSAARFFYCAKASKRDRDEGCEGMERKKPAVESAHSTVCVKCNRQRVNVSGSCQCHEPEWVRVQQTPRGNHHPTVKPTDLMRYLCRLVTQPNGTVLDPFMGSGSTGKAALLEDFAFIGIEREAEYLDIARARIEHAINNKPNKLL